MVAIDLNLRRVTDFSLVTRCIAGLARGIVNEVLFVAMSTLDRCRKTRPGCTGMFGNEATNGFGLCHSHIISLSGKDPAGVPPTSHLGRLNSSRAHRAVATDEAGG